MSEKVQNTGFAQSSVSDDTTSVHPRDIGNTEQTEKEQTTMLQELNALANRVMNGDDEAFSQLYSTFFTIATGYSYKLPEYIREEFLQDMGRRLVVCLTEKRWQDTGIPFEAWIHKTASNTVYEWWRTIKKRSAEIQDPAFPYEEVEDTDSTILDQMLQQEEQAILWSLVMDLPEIQAIVVYERYALNKSFYEISKVIGKTEVNCRKICQRGLESLRQLIHASGYYPEYERCNTENGTVSLENDDSSRGKNQKEAHNSSQQGPL
jgi:RNA polymerase sigma-70 factor (ECF subfamily)